MVFAHVACLPFLSSFFFPSLSLRPHPGIAALHMVLFALFFPFSLWSPWDVSADVLKAMSLCVPLSCLLLKSSTHLLPRLSFSDFPVAPGPPETGFPTLYSTSSTYIIYLALVAKAPFSGPFPVAGLSACMLFHRGGNTRLFPRPHHLWPGSVIVLCFLRFGGCDPRDQAGLVPWASSDTTPCGQWLW